MGCGTRVLALSGGGFRGLFTAQVLARLERYSRTSISGQFDLITGTSIGGILALGLANGLSPNDLVNIFTENGERIFRRRFLQNGIYRSGYLKKTFEVLDLVAKMRGLIRPLYSPSGLRSVLEEIFGDKTMGELTHANVIIPTANVVTGKPKFFKTGHHPGLISDKDVPVVDVALATSAAPVYFPIHRMDNSVSKGNFVDGGLFGNAPGLFGYIEAIDRLGADPKDVAVLSIGTLANTLNLSTHRNLNAGIFSWIKPHDPLLVLLQMSLQERQTDNMLNILLKERYAHIDGEVTPENAKDIDLDNPSEQAQQLLLEQANDCAQSFLKHPFFSAYLATA